MSEINKQFDPSTPEGQIEGPSGSHSWPDVKTILDTIYNMRSDYLRDNDYDQKDKWLADLDDIAWRLEWIQLQQEANRETIKWWINDLRSDLETWRLADIDSHEWDVSNDEIQESAEIKAIINSNDWLEDYVKDMQWYKGYVDWNYPSSLTITNLEMVVEIKEELDNDPELLSSIENNYSYDSFKKGVLTPFEFSRKLVVARDILVYIQHNPEIRNTSWFKLYNWWWKSVGYWETPIDPEWIKLYIEQYLKVMRSYKWNKELQRFVQWSDWYRDYSWEWGKSLQEQIIFSVEISEIIDRSPWMIERISWTDWYKDYKAKWSYQIPSHDIYYFRSSEEIDSIFQANEWLEDSLKNTPLYRDFLIWVNPMYLLRYLNETQDIRDWNMTYNEYFSDNIYQTRWFNEEAMQPDWPEHKAFGEIQEIIRDNPGEVEKVSLEWWFQSYFLWFLKPTEVLEKFRELKN